MLARGQPVSRRVIAEMFEARISLSRFLGGTGIRLFQVDNDRVDGRVQAVKIKTVDADLRRLARQAGIVGSEPAYEVKNIGIAPHPGGKSLKTMQRFLGV